MGRGKGGQLRAAAEASSGGNKQVDPSKQNAKQLKLQAQQMRKMSPAQIRKRNPEMKNATDAEIEQSIQHIEKMAADSDYRKQAQQQASSIRPEDRSLMGKNPETMTPEEMSRMWKMQQQMLQSNPEQFWRQMESNPQTAGISRSQMESQVNQMANMSPEELASTMEMQKMLKPFQEFMQKLDSKTFGLGKYVVGGIVIFLIITIVRYLALFIWAYLPIGGSSSSSSGAEDVTTGGEEL